MESDVQDQGDTLIEAVALAQLPWLSVFDQDIPAKIFSAICYGESLVVVSGHADVAVEAAASVIGRLREAGFNSRQMTGPRPALSLLHDAVRDATNTDAVLQRPLVVIIAQAETLTLETINRLALLAALKRPAGKPVLRFLLTGTAAIWPVLRSAGFGHLEHDAATHIRLPTKDVPPQVPELRLPEPGTPEPPVFGIPGAKLPRPASRTPDPAAGRLESRPLLPAISTRLRIALTGIGLAGIGLAGWTHLASRPADPVATASPAPASLAPAPPVAPPLLSPDERFAVLLDRENREVAANHLWSPPGDNLIETRRQIDEILPLLSAHALSLLAEASSHTDAATGKRFADITGPALPAGVDDPHTPHPSVDRFAKRQAAPVPQATPASPIPPPVVPLPVVPQPAAGPADGPAGDLVHVTLRYSRGDRAAQARATRMLALLRARGILVDEPEASGMTVARSSLAYYFSQDQTIAHSLAQRLLPGIFQADKLDLRKLAASSGAKLPRPGEISILVGSRDEDNDAGETPAPPGKQT